MAVSAVSRSISNNYNVNFKANEAPKTNIPKTEQDSFISNTDNKKKIRNF